MTEIRKQKIHVVFDTNVLRSEPFYSNEEYNSLQLLVENSHLDIYIPHLVEQEYLHQLEDDLDKNIQSINTSCSKLARNHFSSKNDISKLEVLATEVKIKGFENIEQEFSDRFFCDLSAKKLKIKHKHTLNVFKDYFSGKGVFANKKERKDIPDAFIFEAIKDLKEKNLSVVVLVEDKRFANACKEAGIATYDKLKDFLESDEIQETLAANSQKDFIEYITQANHQQLNIDLDLADHLDGKEITSKHLPSDNNDATIMSVDDTFDLKIHLSQYTHYGENKLSVPFSCIANISIMFFVHKADYYSYDHQFSSLGDWNKHYFNVEEEVEVLVKGDLVLDFSSVNFKDHELNYEECLDDISFEVNAINKIELINFNEFLQSDAIECKCNSCGEITKINCNHLNWELTETTQRSMGLESCYSAAVELTCKCRNEMSIEFDTWEYPVGSVNMTDKRVSGCTINKTCIYNFN